MLKLRELKDIDQPTKQQVNATIAYHKEKSPNPVVSISEMEQFVKANNALPEGEDVGFVVNFQCSPPRTPDNEKYFRIITVRNDY